MNSETVEDGFHERIRQLMGAEQPFAWAKKVGIPSSTFSRIWNERTLPKAEYLLLISERCNVSIDWLLRGIGSDTAPEAPKVLNDTAAPLAIDEELIARITDGISRLYKVEAVRLSEMDLGRLTARTYQDLVNAYDDPDERVLGLKGAIEHLRRELRKPVNTSSKRLA